MSLPVSRLVRVAINLSPLAAARRSFGILMIAGDSGVINGVERFRTYDTIEGVSADFGLEAPEYNAAALYFGQTPKPKTLMIGRWIRVASAAQNISGLLSSAESNINQWNVITSGGFNITIDGTAHVLTALDFSAQTNLNGVASVITTALAGSGTCTWDGTKFTITSSTTGAGVKATGTITLTGNPSNLDTLTVNGTLVTFVTGTPTGNQVKIGGTAAQTSANLQGFLQASADANINDATYSTTSLVTTVTYLTVGTVGNGFTLAESSAAITVSGAILTGGTEPSSVGYATAGAGTDISARLKLTSTTNIALIPGFDAESPVECAAILANMTTKWYGLMFQASVQPTNDQSLDVSNFIEALDIKRIYGVTITDSNILSSLVTNDLASLQKAAGYLRSFCQYSQNAYAIASFLGRAFSVNFSAQNSTINMMFKQEPGVVGENLTTTQANVLKDKRCNVFVDYVNDTVILQYGVMSGSAYFDEVFGLDWLQDAVQNACFNLLYQTTTKIPQTDAGMNQFVNAISGVADSGVNNGLIAPGVWNSPVEFGELKTGDFLKAGYYIFAQPMALQAQSERETRVAPPIQVAVKLAGAINEVDVIIEVNR